MLYLWNKINKGVLGAFGEGVVEQFFKERGIQFWKLPRDFALLYENPEVPARVQEVLEELRNTEVMTDLFGGRIKLKEFLAEPNISDEEKERQKRRAKVELVKGAPDYLTYDPSIREEMYAWELVEVKFGFSRLSPEQSKLLGELSRKIPCSVCLVIVRREGVEIAKVPVSEHLVEHLIEGEVETPKEQEATPIPSSAVSVIAGKNKR